jgi:hypothetical protein
LLGLSTFHIVGLGLEQEGGEAAVVTYPMALVVTRSLSLC